MKNSYSDISIRMFLKKSHCTICGCKLKIIKRVEIVSPADEKYDFLYKQIFPTTHLIHGFKLDIKYVYYVYKCEKCSYEITYEEQKEKQKQLKNKSD